MERIQRLRRQAWYHSHSGALFRPLGQMPGLITCERLSLPVCSFRSWQHIVSLSGCLRVHIYISQTQINLSPASHQLCASISAEPVAISLLSPSQPVIAFSSISRATALGSVSLTQHADCSDYNTLSTARRSPFTLTVLCPSPRPPR